MLAPGTQVGRYVVAHEIGAGAMGIVHAAFDPDLERGIALKVLRGQIATSEARDRLLREARAMARLAHPNVVTVHEVGSAADLDFVAMELIDGETLAEWLRATRRSPAAILDAFLAAGRGLVAAHAAGIVHRDFKPHNVLRSRSGRIAVTDFGLAREAEGQRPPALDPALPIGGEPNPPRAVSRITVTGAVLGTPPYMAPEQWSGGAVTPATDQFAYCVALWEALAGERPYRGPGFDDLRRQVARGPAALDASRIPRRVRGLLVRGLDPDPARRWPSMDALLARLQPARGRRVLALAIATGALAAAAALVVALRPAEAPAPSWSYSTVTLRAAPPCERPLRPDQELVWSTAIDIELRAATSEAHAEVLQAAYRDWITVRRSACSAPSQVREVQLSCLDGVLKRFDALRQAFSRVPEAAAEELQAQLIDLEIIGPRGERAIELAQAAANRVMQPDLAADLASQRMIVAQQQARWDEAFWFAETERAGYAARNLPLRQLQAALARNELRAARSEPRDLEAIVADVQTWRPIAAAAHRAELAWRLDVQAARAGFFLGDTVGGYAELMRLWQDRPVRDARAAGHWIEGRVVDDRRRPVPGATVAAASHLVADSVGIGLPLVNADDSLRVTTTDAAGHFEFHDAAMTGAVVAQFADRRSRPAVIADHVQLVLEPTHRVTGRVDLAGTSYTHVSVITESIDLSALSFRGTAPVGPDGSFALSGVTPGAIRIGVLVRRDCSNHMEFGAISTSPGPVDGLQLAVASSTRTIDVVVRSAVAATLEGAEVFLISGRHQLQNLGEISRLTASLHYHHAYPVFGGRSAGPGAGTIRSGDLLAHVEHASPGELTVCAFSIPDLLDPVVQRSMAADLARITVKCEPIGPDAEVVILDVPPQPRFEP